MSEPRLRLRPGIRVSERSDRTLQVGLHPGRRLVLPDDPAVRGGADPAAATASSPAGSTPTSVTCSAGSTGPDWSPTPTTT